MLKAIHAVLLALSLRGAPARAADAAPPAAAPPAAAPEGQRHEASPPDAAPPAAAPEGQPHEASPPDAAPAALIAAPAPVEPLPRVVLLLHGYTSGAEELAALAALLRAPPAGGGPAAHVHSLDFGAFTRVAHDHNLAVDTLADLLIAAVAALPDRCRRCHSLADQPARVGIVARSFGGIIAREAILRDLDGRQSPWAVDRFITLSSPWMGSTLTRFSTGFQSIAVNGLVRTLLFGFVRPARGGAFGRVQDAQARALRVGSPYLWDRALDWEAHHRRRADAGAAPLDTLHLIGLGAADAEGRGDGVVRLASAYVAPVTPSAAAETLLVPLRHRELWNKAPGPDRAPALAAAGPLLQRFLDEGTLAGAAVGGAVLPLDPPRHPAAPGEPRPPVFGIAAGDGVDPALRAALDALRPTADLHLRVELEVDGRRSELALPGLLSLFVADPEWSREWPGLVVTEDPAAAAAPDAGTLRVAPSPSRQLTLAATPADHPWSLRVEVEGLGVIPEGATRLEADGDPLPPGDRPAQFSLRPQQPNLLRLVIDEAALRAAGVRAPVVVTNLRLQPAAPAPRRAARRDPRPPLFPAAAGGATP